MMSTKEKLETFDSFGRNSRQSREPEFGMNDAMLRMRKHMYDCKPCLRHYLGIPGGQCAIRNQVYGQWATFARAARLPAAETDLAVALLGRQDVSGAG